MVASNCKVIRIKVVLITGLPRRILSFTRYVFLYAFRMWESCKTYLKTYNCLPICIGYFYTDLKQ